jgi:hypothetical protein
MAEAADSAREGLEGARRIHDRIATVEGLTLVARAAAERGEEDVAGRLWGAIEADVERAPMPTWERERDEFERSVIGLVGAAFEAARAEGRALSLDAASELALNE